MFLHSRALLSCWETGAVIYWQLLPRAGGISYRQQQDRVGWEPFPLQQGWENWGKGKHLAEGHSANQGWEEDPAPWVLAHALSPSPGDFRALTGRGREKKMELEKQ